MRVGILRLLRAAPGRRAREASLRTCREGRASSSCLHSMKRTALCVALAAALPACTTQAPSGNSAPPSTAAPSPEALTPAPAAANPAPPPTATATSATSSFKETARLDRELGSQVIPYPFQTCAVIQKPFDSGGPKHRRIYQGHEVLFCCTPCVRAFDANPEPYMPRIIAAAQAARNPAPGTSTPAP